MHVTQAELAHWEHFEHRADIGVRGIAPTVAGAFAQAARAMTAIVTDLASIEPNDTVRIECQEADLELLFVDWLNALVYEMATRRVLFSRFDIRLYPGGRLEALAYGEPVNVHRHHPAVEVKGATYTELRVAQLEDGRWLAQCVVDV